MSVEFKPNNEGCFCFGVANETWSTLANEILRQENTGPLYVDEITAKIMAELMRDWEPPKGWFMEDKEGEGKKLFIHFFTECGGFETIYKTDTVTKITTMTAGQLENIVSLCFKSRK